MEHTFFVKHISRLKEGRNIIYVPAKLREKFAYGKAVKVSIIEE